MDKKLKIMQFAGYLKSSLKSATPYIRLQEIADSIGMSAQYINQITNGKLLPPEETFNLIINVLQPRLHEDVMYRVINLYDEAKFGRSVTLQKEKETLSATEAHFLKLFNQATPEQQLELLGIMDQYLENNRTQMAQNAGFVEEPQGPYDTAHKVSGDRNVPKKDGKSDKS